MDNNLDYKEFVALNKGYAYSGRYMDRIGIWLEPNRGECLWIWCDDLIDDNEKKHDLEQLNTGQNGYKPKRLPSR